MEGEGLPGTECTMKRRKTAAGKRWHERVRESILILGQLYALESARDLVGKPARWQCSRDEKERRKVGRWDRKRFCVFFFIIFQVFFYICAKLSRRKRLFHLRLRLAVTAISWFLTFCPCLLFCFFSLIFCVFFQWMLIAYAYFSCSSCRHLCFQ